MSAGGTTVETTGAEPTTPMRRLILFGVASTTAAGALGTAFLPYLLVEEPHLLLLTGADMRNLVLVAGTVDLPAQLAIGVPRRALGMACTYGLGLLYGRALFAWVDEKLPRVGRFFAWAERTFARQPLVAMILWPAYATSALAGSTRVPFRRYLPAMVVGQLGFVVFAHYVGAAISEWTTWLTATLAEYMWEATAVTAGLVGLQQATQWMRRRRAAQRAARGGA